MSAVAIAALSLASLLQAGEAQREPELALRVNRSIAAAARFLKSVQLPDGKFPGHEAQHPLGMTALGALALAEAGVRPNDEALVCALRALEEFRPQSTYSASVYLLLVDALRRREDSLPTAQASLTFLIENRSQGVWAYPWSHVCGSNTQFALMALRAAKRAGLEVPEKVLLDAVDGLDIFRHRSGGYLYEPSGEPYAGMTAAALAGFAALHDMSTDSPRLAAALRRRRKDVAAAEQWLAQRFDPTRNTLGNGAWTPFWHGAYMWGIERWCGLTEREEVAGRQWYAEGAEWLVDTQAANGSWTSMDHPIENTCLALLFLRRATVSPGEELAEIYAEIDRTRAEREYPPERPGAQARRLTEWSIAGPWSGGSDGRLLIDPPFDPLELEPGGRAKVARRGWKEIDLRADRWENLDDATGRGGDRQLWCLGTWLVVEPDPSDGALPVDLLVWFELEDGYDIVVDGVRRARERRVRAAINGDVCVPLTLAPGAHSVVVLAEDERGAAAFGARLTSATNAQPSERVSVCRSLQRGRGR